MIDDLNDLKKLYASVRSMYKWSEPEEIPLDIFLKFVYPQINNNPPWQRDDCVANPNGTSKTQSKYQKIVLSIFRLMDIGQIKLTNGTVGTKYDYETLDGAHRVRALKKFKNGEFAIHKTCSIPELRNKKYQDLTPEQKMLFDAYPLQIVKYRDLTSKQKGEQFRIANAGDPVSPMENLNTYHPNVVADLIRRIVQYIETEASKPHPMPGYQPGQIARLFQIKTNISTAVTIQKSIRLKFANKHMCHHEIAARILCMVWHGEKQTPKKAWCGVIGPCDHGENGALTKMYEDADTGVITENDVENMAKKMKYCLDFLADIADARRTLMNDEGLTSYEVTLLSRWFMHYTNYYGPFKLVDANNFYMSFYKTILKFIGSDKSKFIKIPDHEGRPVTDKKGAFVGMLSEWKAKNDMVLPVLWLINEGGFDPAANGSILVRDSKRCFTRKEIEEKLAEQNFTCWITGKDLTLEDARGGHIEAWSEGGKTNQSNFVVIDAVHNAKMSTMNAYEYRRQWLAKNSSSKTSGISTAPIVTQSKIAA